MMVTKNASPQGSSRQSQEERSAITREKLLEGAFQVLRDIGHTGLRSANISATAGVSRGGLLHHYATKDLLIEAVYEWLQDRMARVSLANIAAASDDLLLEAIVEDARQRFFSEEYRVALDILIASREGGEPNRGSSVLDVPSRIEAHVGWAGRLARTGVPTDAAHKAAAFLWYMVRGLGVRSLVDDNTAHDRRVIAFGLDVVRRWLTRAD